MKAEIDKDQIEDHHGTVSLPLEAGEQKRIAVGIVNQQGFESVKIR